MEKVNHILLRYYVENNAQSEVISIIPETAMLYQTMSTKSKLEITDIYFYLKEDGVNIEKIKWIKMYNSKLEGFQIIFPNSTIDIYDNIEIILLIAINQAIEKSCLEEILTNLEDKKKNLNDILQLTNNNKGIKSNVNAVIEEKKEIDTDIIILYANPIVCQKSNGQISAMKEDNIDYESEIELFKGVFEESKKSIKVQIDIANLDNLTKAIKKEPIIFHISCHGSFHYEGDENVFGFNFEDNKGKVCYYSTKDLETLFRYINPTKKFPIDICFLSTCHSASAANLFSETIAKCVICVNSQTKILDKAAQIFAQTFYKKLLEGKSILESFEISKNLVASSFTQGCCCSHLHSENCKNHSHNSHVKKCDCVFPETNAHSFLCGWAKDKIQNCGYNKIEKKDKILLCCCGSPDTVHSESQKFQIVTSTANREFLNEIPFPNLQSGKMEITNENCSLNYNIYCEYKTSLLGRHLILYDIVEFFSSQTNNANRIVNIYNIERGYNKKNFAKFVGKYLFERNFFPQGVFNITIPDNVASIEDIEQIVMSNVDIMNGFANFEMFCSVYDFSRLLLIIYFNSTDNKKLKMIYSFFELILSLTKQIKVVYVSRVKLKQFENIVPKTILLGPISDLDMATLFLDIIDNDKIPEHLQNKETLCKHPLIQNLKGIPNQVYIMKNLLENKKENFDGIITRVIYMKAYENQMIDELKKKFSDYSHKMKEVFILFILIQSGICEDEIESLYGADCVKNLKNRTIFSCSKLYRSRTIYSLNFSNLNLKDFNESNLSIISSMKIIIYYAYHLRIMSNDTRNHFQFKPWDLSSLNTFSIWTRFDSSFHNLIRSSLKSKFQKDNKVYKSLSISQIKIRFLYIYKNLSILLSNHELIDDIQAMKSLENKDTYDEFLYSLEEISICLPTMLKIFHSNQEACKKITELYKLLSQFDLKLAKYRLVLFEHYLTKKPFAKPLLDEIIENMKNDYLCESESYIAFGLVNRFSKDVSLSYFNKAYDIYRLNIDKMGEMRISYLIMHLLIGSWEEYFEDIKEHFDNALKLSEELNQLWYKIHILFLQAKILYYQKDFFASENLIQEIKKMTTNFKDKNYILDELNILLNKIYAKNDIERQNLFSFLIHKPLESKADIIKRKRSSSSIFKSQSDIEDILSQGVYFYKSSLRELIKESFASLEKKIIVKFDAMNAYNFAYALKCSGKVLYISSEFTIDDFNSLYIDKEESVEFEQMIKDLKISTIKYDILIIAIANSQRLIKIFNDMKIQYKYIITFDIPKDVVKYSYLFINECVMNLIENFISDFLTEYIEDQIHIESIFEENRKNFDENYKDLVRRINLMLNKKINCSSRVCFIHFDKSFPVEQRISLNDKGEVEDVSMFKRISGFEISKKPFINSKIYKKTIIESIFENLIVNVYASKDIGVKIIKDDILMYINENNYFNMGMFVFDLKGIDTLKELKELLDSNENFQKIQKTFMVNNQNKSVDLIKSISSYSNSTIIKLASKSSATIIDGYRRSDKYENIKSKSIIILYNISDELINGCELASFFNSSNYLSNSHLVMFSDIKIEDCDANIAIPYLNEMQSAILFIYYLERLSIINQIENEGKSMLSKLCDSEIIKLCKGKNKDIKKFALMTNSTLIDNVTEMMKRKDKEKEIIITKQSTESSEESTIDSMWNNLGKIINKISYEKGEYINFEATNIINMKNVFCQDNDLEEFIMSFK